MSHTSLDEFKTFLSASQALVDSLDEIGTPKKPINFVDDGDAFHEFKEWRTESAVIDKDSLSFDEPRDVDGMSFESLMAYCVERMEPLILLAGGLGQQVPQLTIGRSTLLSAPTHHGLIAALVLMAYQDERPMPLRWSEFPSLRVLRTAVIRERLLILAIAQQRFPASSLTKPVRAGRTVTASRLDMERLAFKRANRGLGDKELARKYRDFTHKKCSTRAFVQSCYRARLAGNGKVTKSHPLLDGPDNP